jgi:predicted nuclease with TOPRIM domain
LVSAATRFEFDVSEMEKEKAALVTQLERKQEEVNSLNLKLEKLGCEYELMTELLKQHEDLCSEFEKDCSLASDVVDTKTKLLLRSELERESLLKKCSLQKAEYKQMRKEYSAKFDKIDAVKNLYLTAHKDAIKALFSTQMAQSKDRSLHGTQIKPYEDSDEDTEFDVSGQLCFNFIILVIIGFVNGFNFCRLLSF